MVTHSSLSIIATLAILFSYHEAASFAPGRALILPPTSFNTKLRLEHKTYHLDAFRAFNKVTNTDLRRGNTKLQASLIAPLAKVALKVSPTLRNAVLLGVAALAIAKRRQLLYPGSSPDPNYSEPLPPGSFGCPFFGKNILKGTKENGPGQFFRERATELGNPSMFKYVFFGKPIITVTGMKNIKQVFSTEFKNIRTASSIPAFRKLFGTESLIMCPNSEEHSFLRRLVGASMTPESIEKAIPVLQKTTTEQIDKLLESQTAAMEDVCTNFTLDIAWRQILGLNLDEAEIPRFHDTVNDWIGGILNPRVMFLPGVRFTKAGRAHAYLVSQIEKKIDELDSNGPDGSTLSAMLFAKDSEQNKRLSRQQIIDNSLLLILAGSETSASTLTDAMLLLGLHPEVYQKLKEEQRALAARYGDTLTREQLDKECPYLEAVIKETMRIKPLAGGGANRAVLETLVVDGMQIPKGYGVAFNIPLTHALDPTVRQPDGSHMDVVKGFKPERWLSSATRPSEFVPFGYGPRYCLGANLAMAEMKVFLASFARRVDFDLVNMTKEKVTWKKSSIIPKPEDGAVIAPRPSSSQPTLSRELAGTAA